MGAVISAFSDFLNAVWDLFFAWHKCNIKGCNCQHYSDEAFFMRLRERSFSPSYGEEVIASGKLGKPLRCDVCGCERQNHGKLQRRLLQPEMMPNGGAVYGLLRHRAEERRRLERSRQLNKNAAQVESEAGKQEKEERQRMIVIQDNDEQGRRHGHGQETFPDSANERLVCIGDKIQFRFKMFKSEHAPLSSAFSFSKFANAHQKDDDSGLLTVTVGARNVVEGLDRGLVGARQGRCRHIGVPATMAYGKGDMVFFVDEIQFLSN